MAKTLPDECRLKLLGQLARGAVLDVGCQRVQNPFLAEAVGFDIVKPTVIQPNYRQFVQGDCQELQRHFDAQSFDTIIAGELIEHLENPAAFLRGCHHALKDDGQLLVTTPNPYHWSTVVGNVLFLRRGIAWEHINLFPYRTMIALLRHTGWEVLKVENASRGMRLWHTTRSRFVPCPKAIAWQLLYLCAKRRSTSS